MQAKRTSKNHRRLFSIAVALSGSPLCATAAIPITPIVRTGDPVPGDASNDTFTFFFAPSINVNGVIGFRSQSKGFGEFIAAPGGLIKRIAVGGDPAPGLPAPGTFSIPDKYFPINSHGEVAFDSTATGGTGAWSTAGGFLQNIVFPGDPLPGHPAAGAFKNFSTNPNDVVLNDSGVSAYYATTTTFPNAARWGIWEGVSKGTTIKVALADDPAPTLAPNTFYDRIDFPVINSSGVLAYHATVTGSATGFSDRELIWSGTPGNIKPVVRSNSLAPAATTNFSAFYQPDISSTGKVAFRASLDFATTDIGQDVGIWAGTAANLSLVARGGGLAPGTGGATFSTTFGDPLINAAGTVSFTNTLKTSATVNATNYQGLWTGIDPTHLTLVARTGDHAPDTPDGVTFLSPGAFPFVLNNLGQVAFTASLQGNTVDSSNDAGLWVYDPLKGTRLVAREGQTLDVGNGVVKTISTIALHTGASSGDGRATSLNDSGQLAFSATFFPGIFNGEFVANIGGTLPGDANQDGKVDIKDFAIMMAHYGNPGNFATGDFNGDTKVNFADFQMFEQNFGKSSIAFGAATAAEAGSVPEPGTITILAVIAAPIFRRRRR